MTYVFTVGGFLAVAGVSSPYGVLAVAGVPAVTGIFNCFLKSNGKKEVYCIRLRK